MHAESWQLSSVCDANWVVCVDDSLSVLDILREHLLSIDGISRVETFNKSIDSIEAFSKYIVQPDLIIVDLNMPDMDGFEVLRCIASLGLTSFVVVLTSEESLASTVDAFAKRLAINFVGAVAKTDFAVVVEEIDSLIQAFVPLRRAIVRRLPDTTELERQIKTKSLTLTNYYQPILRAADNAVVGYETLMRWRDGRGDVHPPTVLLSYLERSDIAEEVTNIVLEKALDDFEDRMAPGLKIAINICPITLSDVEWPKRLHRQVVSRGFSPRDLKLEVVESQALALSSAVLESLARLRLYGYGISLDDFGTGYATFEQFKDLPITEVKIDRGFVSKAPHDDVSRQIIAQTVSLAQSKGVATVAEGVETPDLGALMVALGCDMLQGFAFGRPGPLPACELAA